MRVLNPQIVIQKTQLKVRWSRIGGVAIEAVYQSLFFLALPSASNTTSTILEK
jgi:hypothetical protein